MDELLAGMGGNRVRWEHVPVAVRASIESFTGSPVVEAASQGGGFSPALAARLLLADGRRVFAKAVGPEPNPDSPRFYRKEAMISAALPDSVPAPKLLDSWEEAGWVVLVFADVEGTTPVLPWRAEEVSRVLAALPDLWRPLTPSPVRAPRIEDVWNTTFSCWRSTEPTPSLDPWAAENLALLAALEAEGGLACAGNTLVHGDLRADNVLLTEDGVVFVDWPGACVAAVWFDLVAFLPSVAMQGGPDPEEIISTHPGTKGVDADALTAVIAGVTGYFVCGALKPAVPGLPALREFQRRQGVVALDWLRKRLDG